MNNRQPQVMGILNLTPDSFFAGSRKQTEREIAERAEQIVSEGGTIIDLGAFSTRPGAAQVPAEEEMKRMRNGLEIVCRTLRNTASSADEIALSIDTFRPEVARMAVEEYGAAIINDVSEGGKTGVVDTPMSDADSSLTPEEQEIPAIFREVARLGAEYILMSVQPTMELMISNFKKEIAQLHSLGHEKIILDPGYGFGKDVINGNFDILRRQQELKDAFPTLPLLAGVSRKRMIWLLLGTNADGALNGTSLVNILALERGADILRVHDVRQASEAIKIYKQLTIS